MNTVSKPRRRAIAVTSALTMGMFFGGTSVVAQASEITVEGHVVACSISITGSEPVDLGAPTYDDDGGHYVFAHDEAISLSWQADGEACAGTLHASRSAIVHEAATAVAGDKSLTITSFGSGVEEDGTPSDSATLIAVGVTPAIAVEVPTVSMSGGVEVFGVKMLIPLTSPPGRYSSILTFTVVVE